MFHYPYDFLAHIIREPSKSFAKSVCALEAERRWAVSGTPIQNRLSDLFSLFKFLKCTPFDDLRVFNAHVVQNWKAKSDPNSVAKLKLLVNCLSLRRPKTTIELPPREDHTIHLNFTAEEAAYYKLIKAKTRRKIDSVSFDPRGGAFFNALQWVNELRLICNHGVIDHKALQVLESLPVDRSVFSNKEAQSRFDQLDLVGLAKCSNPECSQDLASSTLNETNIDKDDKDEEPRIEESLELLCWSCFKSRSGKVGKFLRVCNHLPRCPLHEAALESQSVKSQGLVRSGTTPNKLQRVINDLLETPDNIKRFVICLCPTL